jgi:hypothetical protein
MQSTRAFTEKHGITMEAVLTDRNLLMDDMPEGTQHWACTLLRNGEGFTLTFSMGPALEREPTAEDVLDAIASDAAGLENARHFEGWAGEYGYNTDSRKAERTFRAVEEQSGALRSWLGADLFEELLWSTKRD